MPDLAVAALGEAAQQALACENPWEGFAGYVWDVARIQASDPALNDVISRRYAAEQLAVVCRVTEDCEREIIRQAQRAGALRADFTREDDLAHLCESAAELALEDSLASGKARPITMDDLTRARREVRASVGPWRGGPSPPRSVSEVDRWWPAGAPRGS